MVIVSCISTQIVDPMWKKGKAAEMRPVHAAGSDEACDGLSCCLGPGSEKVSPLETTFTLMVEMLYLCWFDLQTCSIEPGACTFILFP